MVINKNTLKLYAVFFTYIIGSPTISGINSFLSIKIILLLSPRLHCLRAYVHDLTERKQCSRGLSSSMILLNRNELIPLKIVGLLCLYTQRSYQFLKQL